MIEPLDALILGSLEGLTEFLPISSTGHLILASHWLGLQGDAVNTFEIVIQAGALGAVIGLYRPRVAAMWRGLLGLDIVGRKLFLNLAVSFLPAAIVGLFFHRTIKSALFNPSSVAAALAVGGFFMVVLDRWSRGRSHAGRTVDTITFRDALIIGVVQCLAMWPGTSRAMVTIVAAMLRGLPAAEAAEYSFLLALPTLGAATLFEAVVGGGDLLHSTGPLAFILGFVAAAGVAALAIKAFIRILGRFGLALFGWYRIALAGLVWISMRY